MSENSAGNEGANAHAVKLVALNIPDEDPTDPARRGPDTGSSTNYFKSAEWSADGTCVVTNSADNHIRTFVIPPELLDERDSPLKLTPYSQIINCSSVDAVTLYPGFDLQEVNTTLTLSAVNDHPIRLNSALTSNLVASYPLINPTTEAYLKPQCLLFANDGAHFVAGSDSLISIFDLSRPGEAPVRSNATGPRSRKNVWDNPGMLMRGLVSGIAIDQNHNVLAAGTLTRHIGLYDAGGMGECLGVFAVQDTEADKEIGGRGITQVRWSPCGRYLYIAERKSQGIMMYDIRKTGQLLGWLEGRYADTNQRLSFDLSLTGAESNHKIWAGGTDGFVRVWKDPYTCEGAVGHSMEHLVHNDAVNSTTLHHSGRVMATTSGQRHFPDSDDLRSDTPNSTIDISLKLWSTSDIAPGVK